MATNTLWVKGAKDDSRVVISERDPKHPGGEVYIANDGIVVEAGQTIRIQSLLRDGKIVEAEAPAKTKAAIEPVKAQLEAETGKAFVQTGTKPPTLAETSKPADGGKGK